MHARRREKDGMLCNVIKISPMKRQCRKYAGRDGCADTMVRRKTITHRSMDENGSTRPANERQANAKPKGQKQKAKSRDIR